MEIKPINYTLIIQCVHQEIGVVAEYTASTPFPNFLAGDSFELLDCEPNTWDIVSIYQRIVKSEKGQVCCATILLVNSPVVENTGYIVRKQNGEEVGPSPTRFGRIKE